MNILLGITLMLGSFLIDDAAASRHILLIGLIIFEAATIRREVKKYR